MSWPFFLISVALCSTAWAQPGNFSSIFGGSTQIAASAVDSTGNVYVAGSTTSPDFPVTAGAFQKTFIPAQCGTTAAGGTPLPFGGTSVQIACPHAFVAKIDPSGTRLMYATYLGGEQQDEASAIAVDASGNAYITGLTSSKSFPVTPGSWQTQLGSDLFNGFITKLNPDGSALAYSTYLPGAQGSAIAVDGAGNVFVAGTALGATFPATPGAFQTNRFLGHQDAFVLKLNAAGSGLIYSTLLGGTFADEATALAIDPAGDAYVAGGTGSTPGYAGLADGNFTPFPATPGALNKPASGGDVFISKLNPTGTALMYSAVFGGGAYDVPQALAIDASGAAYFAGLTTSGDFPTSSGAWRIKPGGGFAGKLNSGGSELVYSTYLTGSATRIVADTAGAALISGYSYNSDLPTTPNAVLPCFPSAGIEEYIVQLNSTGTGPIYSSYQQNHVIAVQPAGQIYLASSTAILDRLDITAPIAPGIRCAVNAANYRGLAIAPGEIVSLFGLGIGPEHPAGATIDSSGKIATILAGTRVLIGGVPAPLLYVSQNQINLVVPFDVANQTQTAMQVEANGIQSLPPFETQVAQAEPGIFTADGSGYGQAAALNQDGTLNSAANPAAQGSIVTFYTTGLGAMTPAPVNGFVPPGPLSKPAAPVNVSINSVPFFLDLQYVGDAPGLVEGAVQINAKVPEIFQPGPQILSVTSGNADTPIGLNVTIYVR